MSAILRGIQFKGRLALITVSEMQLMAIPSKSCFLKQVFNEELIYELPNSFRCCFLYRILLFVWTFAWKLALLGMLNAIRVKIC